MKAMLCAASMIMPLVLPLRLGWAEDRIASESIDFSRQVLPILSEKCFVCHGPDGTDADVLRLDSYAAATVDLGGYRAIDPKRRKRANCWSGSTRPMIRCLRKTPKNNCPTTSVRY